MKQADPRTYSPKELAAKLGLSPRTIERWFHRRRIRGVQVASGHTISIPAAEAERLTRDLATR